MSDMTVLILLALAVAAVPFALEAVLSWRARSWLGRLWPFLFHVPVWMACFLDSVNILDLPQTHYFFQGFWNDTGTYALLGVPITFGLALGLVTGTIIRKIRRMG